MIIFFQREEQDIQFSHTEMKKTLELYKIRTRFLAA